jgi:cellulose synthase/poly-beta-1,6-N-acetylglucosamine synthase-like glycosyltransferase
MWALSLFLLSLLYVLWVIVVYPLVLSNLARRRPEKPLEGRFEPSITAVIPVHNGGAFLAAKLDSVLASEWNPEKLDILVLSDGSSDDTESIAERYASTGRVRLLKLPRCGKAAALNEAFARTDREILLLTDVRQRLHPQCVSRLMNRLRDPEVAAVSGNLQIASARNQEETNVGLYWKYESWIRSNLSRHDSMLGATGPIYALRRTAARPLPPDCLLDDVWLPMQAVLDGYRSVWEEGAIAWDYPTALQTEFRRKVRTQAGIFQLLRQEPRLLKGANRSRWHFVSLKLGRLFLPHVMLMMLLATAWLPGWWRIPALAGQLGFYALAGLDLLVPERNPLKRATAPPRAFVTLLAAAFCAQSILFVEPRRLWKVTYAPAVRS